MDKRDIVQYVDHTLLTPTATWDEIKALCDEAILYHTASVCIPPRFVKRCKEYVKDQMKVCTVIGFPNGYHTTQVKLFEAKEALQDGADELDMVISIGSVKENDYDYVENEIRLLKEACGDKVLKVIIETCLLTDEEKRQLCHVVERAKADFIKTSTGFSTGGATRKDIKLFASTLTGDVKIKAAGGIATLSDASDFLSLGADRLGTSRIVRLLKNNEE